MVTIGTQLKIKIRLSTTRSKIFAINSITGLSGLKKLRIINILFIYKLKQKIHNYCNILYIGSERYVIILNRAI